MEVKRKPSVPYGEYCENAFGEIATFNDRGTEWRVVVAIGRQDTLVSGLKAIGELDILGASGDHLVLTGKGIRLKVGEEVKFSLDYGALLSSMTSPFIEKHFLDY